MAADGSIVIDTKLDNKGFEKGSEELLQAIKSLTSAVEKLGQMLQSSFKSYESALSGVGTKTKQLGQSMATVSNSVKAVNTEFTKVKNTTSSLGKDMDKLGKSIDNMGATAQKAIEGDEKAFIKFQDQASLAEEEVERLSQQLEEFGASKIETDEYSWYKEQIAATSAQLDKLLEKEAQMEQAGTGQYTAKWRNLQDEIERTKAQLEDYKYMAEALESSGSAYLTGADTAGYTEAEAQLASYSQAISEMRSEVEEANTVHISFATTLKERLTSALSSAASAVQSVGSKVATAAKSLFSLNSSNTSFTKNAGLSFKTILKYGLGIRSLYVLFNKLRSAISEGLSSLASYSPQVNSAISSMSSALTTLKNSLASAFAPIITAVAPAIVYLINLLASAINYIGMFIAAITGQKTYTKATAAVADYAGAAEDASSSADDATESAKELERQLAGFDELNVLTENDTGSSGSGGSGGGTTGGDVGTGDLFEEVPIDSSILDWVERIKEMFANGDWEGVGRVIAEGINSAFAKLKDLISWDNVGDTITYYVDAFCGIFNSLVDNIDWDLIGSTFATGFNTIMYTIDTFLTGIDWSNLGAKISEGLNGLTRDFDWKTLGNTIGDYFTAAFNLAISAAEAFNWSSLASGVADAIVSGFSTINKAIANTDWQEFGETLYRELKETIEEIDWSGLASAIAYGIGAAIGAIAGTLWGFIKDAWADVMDWWYDAAYEDGEFTIAGLLEGIWNGIKNIGAWIVENIFTPFINGFKSAFGISSPSKVMMEYGEDIIEGVLNGMLSVIGSVGSWIKNNILAPIEAAFSGFVATVKVGLEKASTWVADAWTALKSAGETAVATVKAAVKKASTWVKDAWTAITTTASTVTTTVKAAVKKASTWVKDAWTAITTTASTVTTTVKAAVKKASTWVADAWTAASTAIAGKAKSLTTTISSAVKKGSTWVADAWTAASTAIAGKAKSVTATLNAKVVNATSSVMSTVKSAWTTIVTATRTLTAKAVNSSSSTLSTLKSAWSSISSVTRTLTAKAVNSNSSTLSTLKSAWSSIYSKTVTLTAKILTSASSAIKKLLGLQEGGILIGSTFHSLPQYARGGVVKRGTASWWGSVNKYAGGTTSAHGTMFVAGEAGPEVVGHVGGRTEVLNQSQLASVMLSSVQQGMLTVMNSFATALFSRMADYTNALISAVYYGGNTTIDFGGVDIASQLSALASVPYNVPIMASGTVVPYSITKADLDNAVADINAANAQANLDMLSAVSQAAGLIVAAINGLNLDVNIDYNSITQHTIDSINKRTLMYQASPIYG